jgi:prephenate dehydratase
MAPRGATLKTIKTVESHVHALGQCRNIIRKLGIKAVVAADTAGAAREVAEAGDISRAALATNLAAKIYGLQILKKNVADAKHNTTRFVVLAKRPKWPSRAQKRVVTTFVFQVRNIPAALYKALGGFATNGVNMTKATWSAAVFPPPSSMPTCRVIRRIARSNWRSKSSNSSRSRRP